MDTLSLPNNLHVNILISVSMETEKTSKFEWMLDNIRIEKIDIHFFVWALPLLATRCNQTWENGKKAVISGPILAPLAQLWTTKFVWWVLALLDQDIGPSYYPM